MKYRSILLFLVLALPFIAHAEYAWDLLKQPQFKSSYLKVLGQKRSEYWLASLSGPSDNVAHKTIDGKDYIFAKSCMQHSCDTYNLVLAFSPTSKHVFVKLVEEGDICWLGAPSAKLHKALDAYYEQNFGNK